MGMEYKIFKYYSAIRTKVERPRVEPATSLMMSLVDCDITAVSTRRIIDSIMSLYWLMYVCSGIFRGGLVPRPPLWPDRRDFFKDELSRLRTAKVAQVTRSVLFSLKCTRNCLVGRAPEPGPAGGASALPRPPSRIRG